MYCCKSSKVVDIKNFIGEECDLIMGNQILQNDRVLSDYGILHNSFVGYAKGKSRIRFEDKFDANVPNFLNL